MILDVLKVISSRSLSRDVSTTVASGCILRKTDPVSKHCHGGHYQCQVTLVASHEQDPTQRFKGPLEKRDGVTNVMGLQFRPLEIGRKDVKIKSRDFR